MKENRYLICFFFFLLALGIGLTLYYLAQYANIHGSVLSKVHSRWGEFGSFLAPFIAIIASILTFFAFYVQYIANNNQRTDITIERLSDSYFRLIDIYRDIINNIQINNAIKGQSSFHFIFYEYKSVHYQTKNTIKLDYLSGKTRNGITINKNLIDLLYLYISFEILLSGLPINYEDSLDNNYKLLSRISSRIKKRFSLEKDEFEKLQNELRSLFSFLIKISKEFYSHENMAINFFPTKKYGKVKYYLYNGWLPKIEPFLNQSCLIFNFLDDKINNEKIKTKASKMIANELSFCKKSFIAQSTYHEIALIYNYIYFQIIEFILLNYELNTNRDIYMNDSNIEELKKRLKRYSSTFDWQDDNYFLIIKSEKNIDAISD